MSHRLAWFLALSLSLGIAGCSYEDDDPFAEMIPPTTVPLTGKSDGVGRLGPPIANDNTSTRVWKVLNQWEDTDTPAAREAGIAWSANSGLNWDQKYALWIASMRKIFRHNSTYNHTFELTTPWGKVLPAPRLDCADVWLLVRPTFAAWYNLPFFMEAYDWESKQRIYFGHFGIRTATGRWNNMPRYRDYYKDYTYMTREQYKASWPRDEKLRKRTVHKQDDQPFLGEGAVMGTYLDEIHLNKRVGHFIRLLMLWFGTPNLADTSNTFNLKADAFREGDVMLYRRALNGSGHTMLVMRRGKTSAGKLTVEVVSGDDPPRQPDWDEQAAAKNRFTSNEGGGPTKNSKGEVYAEIGGGLKRWRVAKKVGSRWMNTFMQGDEAYWIDHTDYGAIGARPAQFEDLLGEVPPAEKRQMLLGIIEDSREHLRKYPGSCAARMRREDAFNDLYDLMWMEFDKDKLETDKLYRKKEDYVFAKLVYEFSSTCCWNSSTADMYQLIMEHVEQLEQGATECAPPPVFKKVAGDYAQFLQYAEDQGKGYLWVPWSADESCPQANVVDDKEAEHNWSPYCDLGLWSGTP